MSPLIFFVGVLAFFWLLIVLPQRRRRQHQTNLLSQLADGDEVITLGGLYGSIDAVAEDHVVLEIAPGTKVRVAKSAVAARIEPEAEPAEPSGTSLP